MAALHPPPHGDPPVRTAMSVLETDYGAWPDELRSAAIAPVWESRVSLDDLRGFIGEAAVRPCWRVPDLGHPLFPKIAVCSWKCFPWLLPPLSGTDLAPFCSRRMRAVLAHWLAAEVEPMLRFFPFVDHQGVNEFRFIVRDGDARLLRSTLRGSRCEHDREARTASDFISARKTGLNGCLVDVAVTSSSTWIVEINPGRKAGRRSSTDRQH